LRFLYLHTGHNSELLKYVKDVALSEDRR
jgi:hypothetical protein